jgi:hypothetical protein
MLVFEWVVTHLCRCFHSPTIWISLYAVEFFGHCNCEASSYEGVSKSFWTGHLEQELQMVQLSATRSSCITVLWVSLVSFTAIILCVASQQVFIVVISLLTHFRNFWIYPCMLIVSTGVSLRICDVLTPTTVLNLYDKHESMHSFSCVVVSFPVLKCHMWDVLKQVIVYDTYVKSDSVGKEEDTGINFRTAQHHTEKLYVEL